MLDTTKRTIATLTAAACLGGGGWAIASSSNGSSGSDAAGTSATSTDTSIATNANGTAARGVPHGQRPDETLLTGDNAATAKAAALAKLPGATVVRVETDADGDAYEAHVTKADGSRATVKFDKSFNVTSVEDR
jgi:hypothetical protein